MRKVYMVVFLMFISNAAKATIIDFSWNSGWQDILTGYVDTEKNALYVTQITPWIPGENHWINPLQPDLADNSIFHNGVWELRAIKLDGSAYDIEDNWDGILGGDWGFASDLAASEIPYLNGNVVENPYFKYYMSIGIEKLYFPLIDQFNYYAHGESYLNDDGTYYSQLSSYAVYYSFPDIPANIDDFPRDVSIISSGGSHTISRAVVVSEPNIFFIFALSVLALACRKVRV